MTMSVAQQVIDEKESLAKRADKGAFFKLAHMVMKHGNVWNANKACDAGERVTPRIREILQKTAVTPGDLTSWAAVSDYVNVSTAFTQSLRSLSVFDRVLGDGGVPGGMALAPLRSRGFTVSVGITGSSPSEKSIKPISSLALGQALVEPRKAAAVVVATNELVQSPSALALLNSELTSGCVAAVDSVFLSTLLSATTPTASAGSSLANIVTDLGVLLAAVTTGAQSKLYWVLSPSNVKKLAMKASSTGAPAWPGLTVNGGDVAGIAVLPSDQISANSAVMVAGDALAGNSDVIRLDGTEQAVVMLDTSPDSPPLASSVMLSLSFESGTIFRFCDYSRDGNRVVVRRFVLRPSVMVALSEAQLTAAIIQGIAPILEDEVKALQAQIAALQARIEELERRPELKYLGVFRDDGRKYSEGSAVTHDGGIWIALKATSERPNHSRDWQLAVKSGGAPGAASPRPDAATAHARNGSASGPPANPRMR
jgi:Phage capsid family